MSMNVFSDISNSIPSANFSSAKTSAEKEVQKNTSEKISEESRKEKIIKTAKAAAPIVIPMAAIPITALITYKISQKNSLNMKNEIKKLAKEVNSLRVKTDEQVANISKNVSQNVQKDNKDIWRALLAVAGLTGAYKAGELTSDDKEKVAEKIGSRVDNIDNKSNTAINSANIALTKNGGSLSKKYAKSVNGIPLLVNNDSLNRNEQKYDKAIKDIQTSAPKYLYQAADVKPIDKENPVIWSITSEFSPIKEGGLGSVPAEVQNNAVKLGVKMPAFIPMYQQNGIANFREQNGKYIYTYKGKEFNLEKAAAFKTDSYQSGKLIPQNVEIYVSNTKDKDGNDKQLVFVKNDNYFNGTIYESNNKTEEPEKFAFFSKAVYEFAKAKEDITSVKDLKIDNKSAFDSIEAPDGLILNDWQASPVAALARYKAPMENAYGQLSDSAAEKLKDMRIITIGHNAMYQGSTRNNNDDTQRYQATANVLNTLFDDYTYDIVSNAKTDSRKTDPDDEGLKNLDNVLLLNRHDSSRNHTNLLNIGICLSDYFHPVSQNYANEIISENHPELADELRWALNQRNNTGTLKGIINGNDFDNLSVEARKNTIKNQTGLDFKTYNKQSASNEIMEARMQNKSEFYNHYILPFSMKNDENNTSEEVQKVRELSSRLEFVDRAGNTELPKLTEEELKQTPVISSVGRLVSQKGVNIMTEAIEMLMNNWEKDFPGKPKPIFYIAGQDGENGAQRKYIEELKENKLTKEDSDRIVFAHGFAPMTAIVAASDFFLLPSIFEPCGLTQSEAFAVGTPVIGSAVGGIVDTVNRNGKNNGILTDKSKPLTSKEFYEVMKKGLNIYFNDKTKYEKMVTDSLSEDFSWIQPGKKGPEFEYFEHLGISKDSLPDIKQ